MLNVSDEVKEAFKADTATKTISIQFPDLSLTLTADKIKVNSFKLVEAIESDKALNFTGCKSSRLEFECLDLDTDIRGALVVATMTAGTTTPVPIFRGYVYSVSNLNHEDISTEVVCYDKMKTITDLDVADWYNGLTFPMTVKSFRDSFANYCGIDQNSTTLEFDSLQMTKTIDPDEMSGKDVLVAICQANGVFARIDRYGNLDYTSLGTTANEIARSEYLSAEYENFQTAPIGKVQIRTDEDDIGAVYGSGSNCYVVENNFIFFDQDATSLASIAQRIYSKVAGYSYCPITLNLRGLPWFEPGDCITFTTKNNTVTSYILSRTMSGLPFIKDVFTAKGTKERSSQVNSVNSQITQLKGRANRLTRTIDETNSKIDDVEEGLTSQITQTKSDIELQITDLQSQIDGSINVYEREGEPTLLNYPAWDFTYNIPCNDTVQTTEDLHFLYISDYYKKNQRAMCYDETGGQTYRFRKDDSGTYYWEVVQDTEYSVLLSRITALEVKDGEIEASIEETNETVSGHTTSITTLSSTVTQTASSLSSEITTARNNESTLSSRITQTSNSIATEVSTARTAEEKLSSRITQNADSITTKVSKGNVSSEISQESEQITISSNRLVINSSYFKLSADGTMTATNGNFSGKITANSGTIGGLTIASNGIYKSSSSTKTIWQNDGTLVCYDSSNNVKWALQSNGGAIFNGNVSVAGYATSSELNAVSANIDNLTAKAITTDNFSAQNINANKITSGTLSVSRMDVDTLAASGFSGKGISCYSLTASYGISTPGLNVAGSAATWRRIVGSNGSFMALCQ